MYISSGFVKNKKFRNVPVTDLLDLVHGSHITRLDEVFKVANLLLQFVNGDFFVFDGAHDLKFLDSVTNGDELVGSPNQTVHLNGFDKFEHLVHVSFVIPGFAIQKHGSLGDKGRFLGLFG